MKPPSHDLKTFYTAVALALGPPPKRQYAQGPRDPAYAEYAAAFRDMAIGAGLYPRHGSPEAHQTAISSLLDDFIWVYHNGALASWK
jgi:hypothetical protein